MNFGFNPVFRPDPWSFQSAIREALAGCRKHIQNLRPKLAISVYHSAWDFLDIPDYLLSIHPDYRLHLRHYTQSWSETIRFFD
ncbi:hypothetical protein ACQAYK_04685 [Acidithiobacillus sp. AC3]